MSHGGHPLFNIGRWYTVDFIIGINSHGHQSEILYKWTLSIQNEPDDYNWWIDMDRNWIRHFYFNANKWLKIYFFFVWVFDSKSGFKFQNHCCITWWKKYKKVIIQRKYYLQDVTIFYFPLLTDHFVSYNLKRQLTIAWTNIYYQFLQHVLRFLLWQCILIILCVEECWLFESVRWIK